MSEQDCIGFATLEKAMRLPMVPSGNLHERVAAIDICTRQCGQVRKACSDKVEAMLNAENAEEVGV